MLISLYCRAEDDTASIMVEKDPQMPSTEGFQVKRPLAPDISSIQCMLIKLYSL